MANPLSHQALKSRWELNQDLDDPLIWNLNFQRVILHHRFAKITKAPFMMGPVHYSTSRHYSFGSSDRINFSFRRRSTGLFASLRWIKSLVLPRIDNWLLSQEQASTPTLSSAPVENCCEFPIRARPLPTTDSECSLLPNQFVILKL